MELQNIYIIKQYLPNDWHRLCNKDPEIFYIPNGICHQVGIRNVTSSQKQRQDDANQVFHQAVGNNFKLIKRALLAT